VPVPGRGSNWPAGFLSRAPWRSALGQASCRPDFAVAQTLSIFFGGGVGGIHVGLTLTSHLERPQ
jgi:hypothetical protein